MAAPICDHLVHLRRRRAAHPNRSRRMAQSYRESPPLAFLLARRAAHAGSGGILGRVTDAPRASAFQTNRPRPRTSPRFVPPGTSSHAAAAGKRRATSRKHQQLLRIRFLWTLRPESAHRYPEQPSESARDFQHQLCFQQDQQRQRRQRYVCG